MAQGRTNTGCGITQPFAVIAVSYTEGGIATCSDSTNSVTFGTKNANGRWIFNIPHADRWTVRVTYDDRVIARVIENVVERQYHEVELFDLVDETVTEE